VILFQFGRLTENPKSSPAQRAAPVMLGGCRITAETGRGSGRGHASRLSARVSNYVAPVPAQPEIACPRRVAADGNRPIFLMYDRHDAPPQKNDRRPGKSASIEEASRRFRKEADASQKEHRSTSESLAKRAWQRKLDAEDAQTRADKIDTDSRKLTRRKKS